MKRILEWWFTPAKWWYFWRPASGLVGGLIFGSVIVLLIWWFVI